MSIASYSNSKRRHPGSDPPQKIWALEVLSLEPDLLPLKISAKSLETCRSSLPELPIDRMHRFIKDYGRSAYDADVLTSAQVLADYFETTVKAMKDPQLASNFIQTNVLAAVEDVERDLPSFYPDASALAALLQKVTSGDLSLGMAKEVFESMRADKRSAEEIIQEKGLAQVSDDSSLLKVVEKVIADNPKQLADYRSGKDKLFGFFMGQCQKSLQGKGNPQKLKELLEQALKT